MRARLRGYRPTASAARGIAGALASHQDGLHILIPVLDSAAVRRDDLYQHASLVTVFLSGYLLGRESSFWQRVEALRWASHGTVGGKFVVYLALGQLGLRSDPPLNLIAMCCEMLHVWGMLPTLLGWAKRYLNRPFRWLLYCTEAIYAWYVLHQSLLIALLFWAKPLQLGPVLELLLLLANSIRRYHRHENLSWKYFQS